MESTPQGRATRDRIVQAAAALMLQRGVHGTSVDAVLAAAGAGKGQFYHYFESKRALVFEVVRYRTETTDPLALAGVPALDSWDRIDVWLAAVLAQQREMGFVGGCPVNALAAELSDQDEDLRRALGSAYEAKRSVLAEGLAEMKAQGALRSDADSRRLSTFVVAAVQGGMLLASTLRDERPLAAAMEHAWRELRSHAAE